MTALDLMDQVREYRQHAPQAYWDTMGALPSDLDEAHHSTTWIAEQSNGHIRILGGWGEPADGWFYQTPPPLRPASPMG